MRKEGREKSLVRMRLAAAVRAAKERVGTFKELSKEIKKANDGARTIDRRKLSQIEAEVSVTLSVEELETLDRYFQQFGVQQYGNGLGGVLSAASLITPLVEKRDVSFFLGARPTVHGVGSSPRTYCVTAISHWDVRSMAAVLGAMFRTTSSVKIGIEDVELRQVGRKRRQLTPGLFENEFSDDAWYNSLDREDGPSIVCIGSARSCHGTEVMLAKMFGIKPFDRSRSMKGRELPFRFAWPSTEFGQLNSSFSLDAGKLGRDKAMALQLHDEPEPRWVDRSKPKWTTYGIIAAQRRKHNVFVCIAGLTAPGTFAAANHLDVMTDKLESTKTGHDSVCWSVVEADVERPERDGDRTVTRQSVTRDTQIWPVR